MKNGKKLLTILLSFSLLTCINTAAFASPASGADRAYELYKQACRAQSTGSYQYKGAVNADVTVSVGKESKTQAEHTDLEVIGKGKTNSYAVSTIKSSEGRMTTESLLQKGTLYTRTFKAGEEKPEWMKADDGGVLQGDMVSRLQEYANGDAGITYSLGKSKLIEGIEHTHVIIDMDASFVQKIMAPVMDSLTENIIGMTGAGQSQDKTYAAALTAGLYKNMTVDMKVDCFINPRTSLFQSMTVEGSIQMGLLGMAGVTAKISGDFTFYYDSVEPPVI